MALPANGVAPTWTTKAAFLQAVAQGELHEVDTSWSTGVLTGSKDVLAVTNSIIVILNQEYGVPPLPATGDCQQDTARLIVNALAYQNKLKLETLTDDGPNFYSLPQANSSYPVQIQSTLAAMGTRNCVLRSLLTTKTHPIGDAFALLLNEYGDATTQWMNAERPRRVQAYADDIARQRAADTAKDAERDRKHAEDVAKVVKEREDRAKQEAQARAVQLARAQTAVARNAEKIHALGVSADFLNATLYVNYLGQWRSFMACRQWVAQLFDNTNIASVEGRSRGGHPGIAIKVGANPALSFLFRMEGKDAYVYAYEQSGALTVLTDPQQLSSIAVLMNVYASGAAP
ncbi:hypothetical protein [Rhodoferax sp. GW822-FHT02A01]|uniref:hypothetical protein n=1 Tax=Rhodoferax sp. GW822-FHT02A01 TaxID=3141537 RepID=UPI00315CFADB